MKGHLRGGAEKRLDPARVLNARQLDDQPVAALAHDRGLDNAGFVDTPPDDFKALLERSRSPGCDRSIGRFYTDLSGGDRNLESAPAPVAPSDKDATRRRMTAAASSARPLSWTGRDGGAVREGWF